MLAMEFVAISLHAIFSRGSCQFSFHFLRKVNRTVIVKYIAFNNFVLLTTEIKQNVSAAQVDLCPMVKLVNNI